MAMRRVFNFCVMAFLLFSTWNVAESQPKDEQQRQARIEGAVRDLRGTDADARLSALSTLARLDAREHAADVARFLEDPDDAVRWSATGALGKLNATEYVDAIAKRLRDKDPGVREQAAWVLGEFGAKQYAYDIAQLLNDDDLRVRVSAAQALQKLGIDAARQEWGARSAIEQQGQAEIERALQQLNDKDPAVREMAVATLASFQEKSSATVVARLLRDEDARVRGRAAQTLGTLGAKEYAKDVERLLNDRDRQVRDAAAMVLKDWGISVKELGAGLDAPSQIPKPELDRVAEAIRLITPETIELEDVRATGDEILVDASTRGEDDGAEMIRISSYRSQLEGVEHLTNAAIEKISRSGEGGDQVVHFRLSARYEK